ncbi:Muconate cycloisomerase [Alloactinosynnema sp. L-07]|uniref:mandelate racemase/muconate lactonizing enzyme family protein n=1 Tax=Alloactinosynnema sp. L-07 TaxID=1653480 RepID=UPI00065F0886|nr:mandelate racemase/muconate lactonizing enzyme family protein [Alloactinosynnema sp. L-07]CRK57928.1 Muconate cycloisomerase [Alloactinosynnema sp. L-07]
MKIVRVTATEVVVRANPGSIESLGLDKPLHKIPVRGGKSWTVQFDELPKVVIELELSDGTVGLGELYRGHDWLTVEGISATLLGRDLRALCRQDLPFAKVREHDGFEIAIWDAFAKLHGLRVVDLLGGPVRDRVAVGAWTGHRRDDEVGALAKRYAGLGFTCLKFKCALDDDIVAWASAVAAEAPGMRVIFDPNERFERPYETRRLAVALAEVGNVLCLEDPIPHWMRAEYADLRRTSPVPIVRHVALPYPVLGNRIEDAITAVRGHEVDGFNFNAGLADFQRLDHIADVAGLPCWHGSEIDLGVLEAAYVHSAAAARSCVWPSDIFGRHIRSHDLLAQPLEFDASHVLLPEGPGLGVSLDHAALAEHRTDQRTYTAP